MIVIITYPPSLQTNTWLTTKGNPVPLSIRISRQLYLEIELVRYSPPIELQPHLGFVCFYILSIGSNANLFVIPRGGGSSDPTTPSQICRGKLKLLSNTALLCLAAFDSNGDMLADSLVENKHTLQTAKSKMNLSPNNSTSSNST